MLQPILYFANSVRYQGLAFALFTGASIFVLDDVFSALDSQTALEVFQNLFGSDGLFRRWRSTVIMTTTRCEYYR